MGPWQYQFRAWYDEVIQFVLELVDRSRLHVRRGVRYRAYQETLDYIAARMPHVIFLATKRGLLSQILRDIPTEGAILEFGVWKGASITHIARLCSPRPVQGFDSFEGLPEPWLGTRHSRGAYTAHGKLPSVPANVRLHVGLFNDTIPRWLNAHTDFVAFIHIDCDVYTSTRVVLDLLNSRIRVGTVIVFDEYFNYPLWQQHEHRAFQEFISKSGYTYEYLACSNVSVAVRITGQVSS